MMEKSRWPSNWPMIAIVAGAATSLGFGLSYLLIQDKPAAPKPAATTPSAEASELAEIKIPGEYLAAANIVVAAVAAGGVGTEILAPATIASLPNGEATVVARAAGTITRVNRRLGDSVRTGEVLALVDSLDAASMSADQGVAAAKAELARKNYARESSLFEQGVTPRQEMEAAQSALLVAEAEARRASSIASAARVASDGRSVAVVSPIAGKVTAVSVMLGTFVQPQAELFRIASAGAVQVEAAVTATDSGRIATGDTATILLSDGTSLSATVHSITPTVSGSTRTATVLLTPVKSANGLVIGDGVQVRLHAKGNTKGLLVPEDAVQNIEGRDVLFVRTAEGFRPQPVLVGARSGGSAQIISGINVGQQVATRNAFLIKAEMLKSTKDE